MAVDFKSKLAAAEQNKPTPKLGEEYTIGTSAETLPIARIRTDGGTQARAGLNYDTLAEYRQAMQDGATFPPITVFYDGTNYWLADGFHRLEAADQLGSSLDIAADVRPGTQRDAVLYAVGANKTHGLRRSRADVQRAIDVLLRDTEWQKWSDREIGRQVGCHHETVGAQRAKLALSGEIRQIENRTVERNGTTYEQAPRKPSITELLPDEVEEEGEPFVPDLTPTQAQAKIAQLLVKAQQWAVGAYGRKEFCDKAVVAARALTGDEWRMAMQRIAEVERGAEKPEMPPAPTGWRWQFDNGYVVLVGPDGYITQATADSQKALAEAQKRIAGGQGLPPLQRTTDNGQFATPDGWRWEEWYGKFKLISDEGWHTNLYRDRQRAIEEAAKISGEQRQQAAVPTVIPRPDAAKYYANVDRAVQVSADEFRRIAGMAARWLQDFDALQEVDSSIQRELLASIDQAQTNLAALQKALEEGSR